MLTSASYQKIQRFIRDVQKKPRRYGLLVRQAVERHLKDLDKQSTSDFPYHWDPQWATYGIDFYETCLKHTVGKYYGLPFILEPWQAFGVSMIDGWRRDDGGSRRFRSCFWSTARRSGKSTIASGRALLSATADINPENGLPEPAAQCALTATQLAQARIVFEESQRMVELCPELRKRCDSLNDQMRFPNNSKLFYISGQKTFDGLNLHFINLDELHAMKEQHRALVGNMKSGGGDRTQPLLHITTTAGSTRSQLWMEEHKYGRGVVSGLYEDPSYFFYCFEIDDDDEPLDPKCWIKANPNMGVTFPKTWLKEQALKTQGNPAWLTEFKRYHCNKVVAATVSAFDVEAWKRAAGPLSNWQEADAIAGGIDIGTRDDLAAWAFVARFQIGENDTGRPLYRYEIRTQAFCANATRRDMTQQPFAEWLSRGLLKQVEYPITALTEEVIQFCNSFPVADIAFDPQNGASMQEILTQAGIPAFPFAQAHQMFAEPIAELQQALADGRIRHDGNPLLTWCVGNAELIIDHQSRAMFTKRESADKIDPVVAAVMAYRRAMQAPRKPTGPLYVS